MNVKDAAVHAGVTERTFYRWITQGRVTGKRVNGKWEFTPKEIESVLMSTAPSAKEPPVVSTDIALPGLSNGLHAKFREFIGHSLDALKPANVVVLDRKGARAFEALGPKNNYYMWGHNVWHDSVLECLPNSAIAEMAQSGPFYVFDEMVQRGRAFRSIRTRLESVGAKVETYALVGRGDYFRAGLVEDSKVQVCLDLEGTEFSRLVSRLSGALSAVTWPLDVDHVTVQGRVKDALGIEQLLTRMSAFGRVAVVPMEDDGNRVGAISLDRPQYFDTSDTIQLENANIDWRGTCKIRFYFDREGGKYTAAAVTYPTIQFHGGAAGLLRIAQRLLSTQPLSHLVELKPRQIARLVYLAYTATVAAELLRQTRDAEVFKAMGLECLNLSNSIDKRSFVAALGPWLGEGVYSKVAETLGGRGRQAELPLPASADSKVSWSMCDEWQGRSVDIEGCRNELLIALSKRTDNDDWVEQPWTEIAAALSKRYSECTVATTIDWVVDQGPVKPVIIVSDISDSVRVERGGRRGEFGPWFDHNEHTLYHYDTHVRQVLSLSAAITDKALSIGNREGKEGLGSMHFAKLVVNLEHDWDAERMGGPLFAGWWPYLYGPIPVIPIQRQPGGGYHLLEPYAVKMRYLTERQTHSGQRIYPANASDLDWRQEYEEVFDPIQRLVIESLEDEYLAIEEALSSRRSAKPSRAFYVDPLATLAASRNQRLAYICGHGEIAIWLSEGADIVWPQLKHLLSTGDDESARVERLLQIFSRPIALLRQKLDDYGQVHVFRASLEDLAKSRRRPALLKILGSVDKAPVFDDRPPYPLAALQRAQEIASDYTSMLRSRLYAAGLAKDTRTEAQRIASNGSIKNAAYYWHRLIKACPELGQLAMGMEQATGSSGPLNTEEVEFFRRSFFIVRDLLVNEDFLPNPLSDAHATSRSAHYGGYLSLVQTLRLTAPCGILVADIRNFMRIGTLVAHLLGTDKTSAEEDARNRVLEAASSAVKSAAGEHKATICERFSDTFVLTFGEADSLLAAARSMQLGTSRWIREYDSNQLDGYSLLRFGADWFSGPSRTLTDSNSWIAAYAACEHNNLAAGQILVTPAVYERISPQEQQRFTQNPSAMFMGVLPPGGFVADLR